MTRNQIESSVQGRLSDPSADIQDALTSSINFLSVIFPRKTIETGSLDSENSVDFYSDYMDIYSFEIDNEPIPVLSVYDDFINYKNAGVKAAFWDKENTNILLTWEASGDYSAYCAREYSLDTDGEEEVDWSRKYDDLVIVGACWRYYQNLMSKTAKERENLPDITPFEISTLASRFKKQHDSILHQLKINQ